MVPINITVKNKLPTNGQLQYIHGAVKHSTENTVNNIAVRECGARTVLLTIPRTNHGQVHKEKAGGDNLG